jgi:hypothetical protein
LADCRNFFITINVKYPHFQKLPAKETVMFKKKPKSPPAGAAGGIEVLRVLAMPDGGQEVRLQTAWEEPAAWGLLLVDVARHVAKAYANAGHDEAETLARIRQFFDAEWSHPTDTPTQLS